VALKSLSAFERILTHAILMAGCAVFAFPFVWMLSTSAKAPREMAIDRIQLLPQNAYTQDVSPYVDAREFGAPQRPDGVPKDVWAACEPELRAYLEAVVAAWKPETVGASENSAPPAIPDADVYRETMINGLFERLSTQLSDDARQTAIAEERRLREAAGRVDTGISELAAALSPEAVNVGKQAVCDNAKTLINEEALRDTFDQCYRRFCLGLMRVLTQDYRNVPFYSGNEWETAESGLVALAPRNEKGQPLQEARIDFLRNQDPVAFRLTPDLAGAGLKPGDIKRLYVSYRGDAAWSRIAFSVIRDGQMYRTRDAAYLYERDWFEQELIWPQDDADPYARRTFMVLESVGPAPAGSPPFSVTVSLTPNTPVGAWAAKLLRNYRLAFNEVPYAHYVMTSFSLAILTILLAIFSCTLSGYAFARLDWPGRDLCFGILLATMMIPPQVTMIPSFLVMRHLGWYNTLLPIWAPSAFGSAFFIFLVRQFLKNVPRDLEEAARMDGCGFLRVYWHVMLPLVKPTIATIAIFTFMGSWNNFMGPLIFVNDERLFPLALGLFKFNLRSGGDVGLMMAGAFLMTLPIIALFFFVQRYFIQGISLTGTKE